MQSRKLRWMVAGLALALLAIGVVALWPGPNRVTLENLARTKRGMTRPEVEAILGPPGDYTTGPTVAENPKYGYVAFALPFDCEWKADTVAIRMAFEDTGELSGVRWESYHRQEQSSFDNLVWRAKRLWHRWFP